MAAETENISHNVSKGRYLASLKFFSSLQQKKSREYTTVILTFLAIIIFGVFAINPTLTTIIQLRKQLEDSTALNNQFDEKIRNLQSLQTEYNELTPDLPLVESALPPLPNTPILLGQIQSLIKNNNLSISQILSSNIPYTKEGLGKGATGSYVVAYTVSGKYTDIDQFLKDVVVFDRIITIDEVVVARDEENPTQINGTAKIKAYFDQKPL